MTWRDLLRVNLGSLLRGQVLVAPGKSELSPAARSARRRDLLRIPGRILLGPFTALRPLRRLSLILFTEYLARVVACNAPLVPAFDAAIADTPSGRMFWVLYRLRTALARGMTLPQAMRSQPRFFPQYYIDLVQAAQNSGSLSPTLVNLARSLDESTRVRDTMRRCIFYLFFLFVFASAITSFLMIKVFPVFSEIIADFTEAGQQAESTGLLATAVNQFSNAGAQGIMSFLAGVIGLSFILAWLPLRSRFVGRLFGSLGLLLPFTRTLILQSNLARVAKIIEMLTAAGYPVDEAVESAAGADVLPAISKALYRVRDQIWNGKTFGEALARERRIFPASFQAMAALGESAGNLPEALARLAHWYECRVTKVGLIISRTFLPIGVMLMGVWVLAVYTYPFVVITQIVDALITSM